MRALTFSAIVAVLFIVTAAIGGLLVEQGYGLPTRFSSVYKLSELGLLSGVGRETGNPVVYEWPIATLLKPGKTNVTVEVLGLDGRCPHGGSPVTIKLLTGGVEHVSNSTTVSIVLYRNSMFLVLKTQIEVNSNCVRGTSSSPLVTVNIETVS